MTATANAWAEKSAEQLLAALESLWFYDQTTRAEICDAVEQRRLLGEEPRSLVVEQLRRYDDASPSPALHAVVDLTSAARWRGAASLAPRALVAFGVLLLLLGSLEFLLSGAPWGRVQDPGALVEGVFNGVFGVILFGCALLLDRYPRTTAAVALAALSLPMLLWIAWLLLMAFNGRLDTFRPVLMSFLAIVCFVACVATLRLQALRRRHGPAAAVRPRARFQVNWKDGRAVAALCAALVVFAAGVAVWLLAGWLRKTLVEMGGLSPLDGALALGLNLLGLALAFLAAPALWRLARRFASMSARQLRRLDSRHPLLLLRSFSDDAVNMTTLGERLVPALFPPLRVFVRDISLEEALVTSASGYGPVVALNDPASRLPPVGAAREVTRDAAWRTRIGDLIRESQAIIAVIGETPGLKSELLELRRADALGKLVLILPPFDTGVLLRRIEALFSCIPELQVLPVLDLLESGVAICLADDGYPTLIAARRRAAAYAEAVDWALNRRRPSNVDRMPQGPARSLPGAAADAGAV